MVGGALGDYVCSHGLAALTQTTTHIRVCAVGYPPASYDDVIARSIGYVAAQQIFGPDMPASDGNGRMVVSRPITPADGGVWTRFDVVTGWWAATDEINSRLLVYGPTGPFTVGAGSTGLAMSSVAVTIPSQGGE